MKQEKMYLINKLFNDKTIRTVQDKEEEKYYVSVVDVVGAVSESDNPQVYWRVMKERLVKKTKPIGLKENIKVARQCGQVVKTQEMKLRIYLENQLLLIKII